MHILQSQRREVTVHVESIEMGLQCGILPLSFSRHADATVIRLQSYCHEIEAVLILSERLMGQNRIHSDACIIVKHIQFLCRITFRNYCHVNLVFRRPALQEIFMLRNLWSDFPYKDIVRINDMTKRSRRISPEIIQFHTDLCLCIRHRQQENILKRLTYPGRLLGGLPLLEKGRERLAVEHLSVRFIRQRYLPVATHRHLVKIDAAPCPSFKA